MGEFVTIPQSMKIIFKHVLGGGTTNLSKKLGDIVEKM